MKNRIGIDIGGTQLRAAVLDENYRIIETFKTKNDRSRSCTQPEYLRIYD